MKKILIIGGILIVLAVLLNMATAQPISPFVIRFLDLIDVAETSFVGEAGEYVRVNAAEDGLEFVTLAGGGDFLADGSVPMTDVLDMYDAAAPTTNVTGEFALDTTIADHQPLFQYYDGGENMTIIAIDTAELPALDNEIVKYDAGTDKFVLEADAAGGGNDVYVEEGDVARVDTTGADLYVDFDDTDFDVGVVGNEGNVSIVSDLDIVTTSPLTVNAGANLDDVLLGADGDITLALIVLKDVVATSPLLIDGVANVDNILVGGDADVTISATIAKDIVATSPLTVNAGANLDNVIIGTDADITIAIADADDDGATKGAASFDNTDFDAVAGNVTIVNDGHTHTGASVSGIGDAQVDNNITIDLATLATTVTLADDDATDDNHDIVFTTDAAGPVNLEADIGDFYYNPSAGMVTAPRLELSGGNITYLDIGDDIETAIAAATAGDTIVLAAGTYTVTDDIDIAQAITVIGQGRDSTTILTVTDSKNVFHITADNVHIKDLFIDVTADGSKGVHVDATGGNVFSNVTLENVDVTLASHAGVQYAVYYADAGGLMRNCEIFATSADDTAVAVELTNVGTAEAITYLYIHDSRMSASAGANNSIGAYSYDNAATQDCKLYLYYCYAYASEGGASSSYGAAANNGDAALYAYYSYLSATDYDAANLNTAIAVGIYGCILYNNTTSGTITRGGTLQTAGLVATGTVEGATLTEGGLAVYNSGEEPSGSLGGTYANITIDDLFIKLAGDVATAGDYDFGGANVDLEIPQTSPAVPDVDGQIEYDFTDGKLVMQHSSGHTELGGSTDVALTGLIKSWGGTIYEPDGINDVITVKAINSIEFPHGVVITAVYLGVSEDSDYTLIVQNFDDFDTINGVNPTIDTVTYSNDTTGEIIDTTPTYDDIAPGQIIMISIPATDVAWINFSIYYYEPAAG